MRLLRNIRIPQNLGNKFAHACTRPSRLGLEFEANILSYTKQVVVHCVAHCTGPAVGEWWTKHLRDLCSVLLPSPGATDQTRPQTEEAWQCEYTTGGLLRKRKQHFIF